MKYILLCVLLAGSINLSAAEDDRLKEHVDIDPLYLQLYAGINKSANENLPWTEFSGYPWSVGVFAGIGKEWSPLWGWRAAFRYNHNKSRNVRKCESPDTWGWDNLGLWGDVTFDITDALSHGKESKDKEYAVWNVKAFAGVGAAYTFGFNDIPLSYQHPYNRNSRVVMALRAGVNATYQVSKNVRLGLELSHNIFQDKFNGVDVDIPVDTRTNLKVGITYIITGKKKPKPPVIIYDTRLRTIPVLPFMIPDDEDEKVRKLEGRAFLDFVVDNTEIKQDYRRNSEEINRIVASINSVLFDKTMQVRRINLHGYASPESPYAHNVKLSKGRVTALKSYLQKHYRFDSSIFTLNNTAEDWDNLRKFIEEDGDRRRIKEDVWYESDNIHETPTMPEYVLKHKETLLDIIRMDIDPDEKEQKLKEVANGEPYRWLLKHVYPGLRHTDYAIEYVVRKYPVKEAKRLIYTHPEALSLNEMYRVASSHPEGSDGWLDALIIAAKQHPDDKTANLNAACACVRMKRLADAKRYLSKAGDSEQAIYLGSIISAMDGSSKWRMENGKVVLTEE